MLQYLLISLLVSAPDPSTRTHAWRVVDQVSGAYKCEYACSTTATDAARDTACIQSALDVVTGGTKYVALELPKGVCRINAALKVNVEPGTLGSLDIYGQGTPWTTNRSNFGDGSWTSTSFRGTVLYSDMSSGAILTLGTDETITSVNTGTEYITISSATHFAIGDWVSFRNDLNAAHPAGIDVGTGYIIEDVAGDTIKLTGVNLTAAGTGTTHITNSPGGRWILRDFAVMGFGGTGRTTKGVQIVGGSGIALIDLQGVTFANLYVGLDLGTVEDGAVRSLAFYGNSVGFLGDGHTNSNLFTAVDCSGNTSCGILKGSTNSFFGGTVQGSLNYGLRFLGGENQVTGVYFEDLTTTGAAISDERSGSWIVRDISAATNVLTLDGPAPTDNTTVYVWVDGASSVIPTSVPAVSTTTVYHVWGSSGRVCTLRTATAGGGTELDFSTAGTGNVRMTNAVAEAGYNVFVNNHYGPSGDDISLWKNNTTFRNPTMPNSTVVQPGTSAVTIEQPQACTDGGVGSYCQSFSNGGLHFSFTNPVVASPGLFLETASALYFNLHTASGLNFNWECRDALGYCQFRDATNDAAFLTLNPNGAGAGDNEVEIKAADFTVEGDQSITGALTCNTIDSTGAGTTIEQVLLNNGLVDGINIAVLSSQVNACYAAVGDGVTDDTAALQACIDATPEGGALFLSEGTYLITAGLVVTQKIYLHGTGASGVDLADNYAFGSASWASAMAHGTVIKTAMTTGTMIAMSNNDPHFIVKDIAFWNTAVGAHTTVGLSIASTGGNQARPRLENLTFANLSVGASTTGAAGHSMYLYAVGNDLGVQVGCVGASLMSLRLVNNGTGIRLTSAATDVVIVDGYFSGNTTAVNLLGARANTMVGGVFTGNTTALLIEGSGGGGTGTGGDQNSFKGAQYITNDPVSVYTDGNHFEFTGITASPAITLQTGAAYNQTEYRGGFGGTYTDSSGQQNFRIMQSANGLEWYDSDTISFEDGMISSTSATIGSATISAGDFSCAASTDHVYASLVDEFPASNTGVTADGVLLKDGDVSTAATGDFVKTDHVEEFTATNGVKVDSSGGAGTTTTIKDGYVAGIGFTSVDGTCGISVTDDATDAVLITATTLTANATTVDINANLTPDRVTIMSSGGNVCRVIYNDSNGETTTGTILETVKTLTLPGGTVANDGDSLEFDAYAECDATANNKVFDFYFNGANSESSSQNCNGNAWHLHAIIWRRSSTAYDYEGSLSYTNEGGGTLHAYDTATWSSGTWATNQDFKFNLTTTDTGGAQLNGVMVKYCPAVP